MRTEKSLDGTLKRYVFGALDEDTRLVLEERVVTEPEVFDALGVMEDEIVEAYLEGTLPDTERRAFERHFMVSEDRRRRVSLIRMLKHHASDSTDVGDAAAAFVPGLLNHLTAHPWWAGAMAASVVALVGGNLWLAMTASRLQDELARSRAAQSSIESRPRATPSEQAAVSPPPVPVEGGGGVRYTGARSRTATPPTFALVSGLLRGGGTTTRVAIPGDAETIRLLLELQAVHSPVYRVVVLDAGGEELLTLSKLKADRGARGAAVTVVLPSAVLARGDYQARLSGQESSGEWNDIATYTFRVTAADPAKPR